MLNNLEALFSGQGMFLSDKQKSDFCRYAALLVEWNEKINLTAITDDDGISEKHFLDSVLPLTKLNIPDGASLVDVGTGAGFPAIPMKIYRSDLKITLLDSLNKRISFLEEVSSVLGLDAVCVHSRAEDGGRNAAMREKFNVATARAVAAMPTLAEYCLPFVTVGGLFLAMKGPTEDVSSANNAVKLLGGEIEDVIDYKLPCGDGRKLIVIRKVTSTPVQYPRDAGKIKKKPL